uniref:ubiquitinyl hydrolase 1 n=1 Tax=Macrostomum lignano TaxID=282301 RepID=A0A1I8FFR3_9PLAT
PTPILRLPKLPRAPPSLLVPSSSAAPPPPAPEAGGLAANLAKQRLQAGKPIKPLRHLCRLLRLSPPRHHRHQHRAPVPAQAQVPPRVANGGGRLRRRVSPARSARSTRTRSNRMAAGIRQRAHGLTGLRQILAIPAILNSTVQCLSNTPVLASYFLQGTFREHVNKSNPLVTKATWQNSSVVSKLCGRALRLRQPVRLQAHHRRHAEAFAGNEQQDSQEFLLFLLDGLPRGFESGAGQFKSTLVCEQCHYKSITFDAFMYLSLPVVSDTSCRLSDCLQAFLKPERLSGSSRWFCPRCRRDQSAVKKIDIWRLPPYLLIHFKRFSCDRLSSRGRKLNTLVDYPSATWTCQPYHSSEARPKHSLVYNLYGVSNHFGSMECGHYTAFCRNSNLNRWFKFETTKTVTEMRSGEIRSVSNYILFYSRLANTFQVSSSL